MLSKDKLWKIAQATLQASGQTSAPIDIDLIIESAGLNIIPMNNFKRLTGNSGALSGDFREIYYDEREEERYPRRLRFTLAHEFAHYLLHGKTVKSLKLTSKQDWKKHVFKIYNSSYNIEREADNLAGFILVPSNLLKLEREKTPDYELHNVFDVSEVCMRRRLETLRYDEL